MSRYGVTQLFRCSTLWAVAGGATLLWVNTINSKTIPLCKCDLTLSFKQSIRKAFNHAGHSILHFFNFAGPAQFLQKYNLVI